MQAVRLTVVVGPDDVRVIDSGAVFRFPQKTLHGDRVLRQPGTQNLYGRNTPLRMLGTVHCCGTSLADVLGEVVSGDGPAGQGIVAH